MGTRVESFVSWGLFTLLACALGLVVIIYLSLVGIVTQEFISADHLTIQNWVFAVLTIPVLGPICVRFFLLLNFKLGLRCMVGIVFGEYGLTFEDVKSQFRGQLTATVNDYVWLRDKIFVWN